MSLSDGFRFDGKRVLVVGGATGMGAAAAELALDLGAEVVVMDRAEVTVPGVTDVGLDLASRVSIDAAVDACGAPVHALLACAGVADGTPGIERINFVGHRYLIDRMLDAGILSPGSAIGFISSTAGLGWESNLEELSEVLAISDFDEAAAWFVDHRKADYLHTKQAMCAYVATRAYSLLRRNVRVNAICPGPTVTPLAVANKELWLEFGADYRSDAGVEASTPMEQAYPLLFLCSDAAVYITGVTLIADAGYMSAGLTGAYPAAADAAKFLMGRM